MRSKVLLSGVIGIFMTLFSVSLFLSASLAEEKKPERVPGKDREKSETDELAFDPVQVKCGDMHQVFVNTLDEGVMLGVQASANCTKSSQLVVTTNRGGKYRSVVYLDTSTTVYPVKVPAGEELWLLCGATDEGEKGVGEGCVYQVEM